MAPFSVVHAAVGVDNTGAFAYVSSAMRG